MVVGLTLFIVGHENSIGVYILVISSFAFVGFAVVIVFVFHFLSVVERKGMKTSEDKIRHFFDRLNHERFMSRGVQLLVESTVNFAVVGYNVTKTLHLRLVIEISREDDLEKGMQKVL